MASEKKQRRDSVIYVTISSYIYVLQYQPSCSSGLTFLHYGLTEDILLFMTTCFSEKLKKSVHRKKLTSLDVQDHQLSIHYHVFLKTNLAKLGNLAKKNRLTLNMH